MTVHYWAGYINVNTILQHTNIVTWATQWLYRAELAAMADKELVVFEIPKNELTFAIRGIEGVLQNELGMLAPDEPKTAGSVEEIFDMMFIHNLMMPPDGV